MALPQAVTDYLNENAQREGLEQPGASDDLFRLGVLDSFALVDFISVLEAECGIKIPDADVNPGNFQSLEAIERYVDARKG
jgi:acyl carrier protein